MESLQPKDEAQNPLFSPKRPWSISRKAPDKNYKNYKWLV